MTHAESDHLVAFNAGADARFHCYPVTANPYSRDAEKGLATSWKAGWDDLDQHWGELARWPVALLLGVWEDVA